MKHNKYPMDEFDRWQMGLDILTSIEHNSEESNRRPTITPDFQSRFFPPSLEQLIRDLKPMPEESIIIGVCEDGLPILLELNNPDPGSILILGDPGSGKLDLICSILKSGIRMNPPRKLRYTGILHPTGELGELMHQPHAYPGTRPGSHAARDLLIELAEQVDKRNSTDQPGPAILLVIDNLAEVVQAMDNELQYTLTWLIQYGPEARIWTMAGLDPANADMLPSGLLESFGKCIIGRINPSRDGTDLAKFPLDTGEGEQNTAPFSLSFQNDWLPFWLPG